MFCLLIHVFKVLTTTLYTFERTLL